MQLLCVLIMLFADAVVMVAVEIVETVVDAESGNLINTFLPTEADRTEVVADWGRVVEDWERVVATISGLEVPEEVLTV